VKPLVSFGTGILGSHGQLIDLMSFSDEQRISSSSSAANKEPVSSGTDSAPSKPLPSEDSTVSNSNLVFGYLNLFSDGVVSLLNTLLYHSHLYVFIAQ
jgi:hypothetical protein